MTSRCVKAYTLHRFLCLLQRKYTEGISVYLHPSVKTDADSAKGQMNRLTCRKIPQTTSLNERQERLKSCVSCVLTVGPLGP